MNVFKRLESYIAAIFKLGRTERFAKAANRKLPQIEDKINHFENKVNHYAHHFDEHTRQLPTLVTEYTRPAIAELAGRHSELARGYSDLTRRLDHLFEQGMSRVGRSVDPGDGQDLLSQTPEPGFDALRQSFYHRLENEYRGSLADIRAKLRIYLPDVEAAYLRTGEKPVLDLGCGRGEWLELLRGFDIPYLGVDTNSYQIEEILAAGHNVKLADAIQTLKDAETGTYGAITAFHLVEHLPFETTLWLVRESLRVLAP